MHAKKDKNLTLEEKGEFMNLTSKRKALPDMLLYRASSCSGCSSGCSSSCTNGYTGCTGCKGPLELGQDFRQKKLNVLCYE